MGLFDLSPLSHIFGGGGQPLSPDKYQANLAPVSNYNYSPDISATLHDVGQFRGMNEAAAGQQQDYISQLQNLAQGNGPSPASIALANALSTNAGNTARAVAGTRGINPALAAKMAADTYGQSGSELAAQGSLLKSQEQLGAYGQLGNALSSMRGQDIQSQQVAGGLATGLGGLANAENANNITNQMEAQRINAGVASANTDFGSKLLGGLTSGASGAAGLALMAAHGGKISHPDHLLAFAEGIKHAHLMLTGGKVDGKANVDGDSEQNDTVPAMLSPGEVVIPRSKANNPEAAKKFVAAIMARKKGKHESKQSKAA